MAKKNYKLAKMEKKIMDLVDLWKDEQRRMSKECSDSSYYNGYDDGKRNRLQHCIVALEAILDE